MKLTAFRFALILPVLVLASCEKQEDLYPAPKGIVGLQTATVEMGEERHNEIWYSLSDQTYDVTDGSLWDLGFSCQPGTHHIIINNGNDAWLHRGDTGTFAEILKVPSIGWKYDAPSGHKDSTALGTWCNYRFNSFHHRYILDRGMNFPAGQRYIKFMLDDSDADQYVLLWGRLDDFVPNRVVIKRDPTRNYVYFGFGKQQVVQAEPRQRDQWDVVFRKYKTRIPEPGTGKPYDYVVVGCMLNPNNTECAELNNVDFEKIDRTSVTASDFSHNDDVIGFDWKTYDLVSGKYIVNYRRVFVLKTHSGRWFKLRFVDYYNDLGVRGYPKMEFQEI